MRSRFWKEALAASVAAALTPALAFAASHTVNVGVAPSGAVANEFVDVATNSNVTSATVGDTVTLVNVGAAPGFHNVRSNGPTTIFRCAEGCDGVGNGNPAATNWSVTITLTTPDTINYYCEAHGLPGQGMFGTINVTTPVELQSFGVD